jgi:hypothetical protein
MNIVETYKQTVIECVKAGGGTRWGEAESRKVIRECAKAAAMESGLDATEASALADSLIAQAGRVINPSAFAQKLEDLPADHPAKLNRPKRGERAVSTGLGL